MSFSPVVPRSLIQKALDLARETQDNLALSRPAEAKATNAELIAVLRKIHEAGR